jgi:ADP-ribosylglycohydrolase
MATAVTHRDPRPAACAAAVASAVAGNLHASELCLGPFLDRLASAAGRHDAVIREAILDFPRILSQSESRALRLLTSLSPDSRYPQENDGLSEYCVPAVLISLYYFLRSPYEYSRAVESCLRIGGRFDVTALATGAMVGALLGETGIPAELASGVLNSAEIHRRATEIHEVRMRT